MWAIVVRVKFSVRARVRDRFRVCILMRSDDRFRKSVRARVRDTEVFAGFGSRFGAALGLDFGLRTD